MASIASLRADADRVGMELAQLRAALRPRPPALDLATWSERHRGLTHPPFIREWCDLAAATPRLCVLAPRDHGKSETFAVNQLAWRVTTTPGFFGYLFSATQDQAASILRRICDAVAQADPTLRQRIANQLEATWANGSRVKVAGAGKSVRGDHPDLIVGDDVLTEDSAMTAHTRRKMDSWWRGTVGGMATTHTSIHLVGTPFHAADLLMSLKTSPVYTWRRYAAEFEPGQLVDGWAVEVGRPQTAGTVTTSPKPAMVGVGAQSRLTANQEARLGELERVGWRTREEELELEVLRDAARGLRDAARGMSVVQGMVGSSNGGR